MVSETSWLTAVCLLASVRGGRCFSSGFVSVYVGVCTGTVGGRRSGLVVCRHVLRCPIA